MRGARPMRKPRRPRPRIPKPPRFGSRRRRQRNSWAAAWHSTRPFVLLIALAVLVATWREPGLIRTPDFLSTEPQRISAGWTLCSRRAGSHCVIDGDSFRIDGQDHRIIGFDTPEMYGDCESESRLARRARARLLQWLGEGPFWMRGRWDEPTDRYDRPLRELYREDAAGERAYLADHMIEAGLARRYAGGFRAGWCD